MEQVFLKVNDSDIARENERTAASGEVDSNSRDEANMNVSNIARRLFMQQGWIANDLISEKNTNKHQNVLGENTNKFMAFYDQLVAMIYRHFL